MAAKNERVSDKGAKPVGEPSKGFPRDTPEGPVVDGGVKGEKPVAEPDKNQAQRTGPELPVVEPIDGSDYDKFSGGDDSIFSQFTRDQLAKVGKPVPGTVTYRTPDGKTVVTNEVADIHNPPPMTFDGEGAGEVVDRVAKE